MKSTLWVTCRAISISAHEVPPPLLVDVYESLGFKQSYSLVSVTLQNRFVKIFLNPSAIMYLCTVADPTESSWIINIQSILENMSPLWPSLIPSSVIYFVHVDFCKYLLPLWLVILLSLWYWWTILNCNVIEFINGLHYG